MKLMSLERLFTGEYLTESLGRMEPIRDCVKPKFVDCRVTGLKLAKRNL